MAPLRLAELDALVEATFVDAYHEDEQRTGLCTMIADNLAVPFTTLVLGVEVTVHSVDLRGDTVVAICHPGRLRQAIGILELPLPDPPPAGSE